MLKGLIKNFSINIMYSSNKYIITFLVLLVLILGVLLVLKTKNQRPTVQTQLTDQQKLDILSTVSDVPTQAVSDIEKLEILNTASTSKISNLTDEEKIDILNRKD